MQPSMRPRGLRWSGAIVLLACALALAAARPAHAAQCGTGNYPFPFTDVGGIAGTFCLGILEAYVTGITRGTTPTTFSPDDLVPRVQMTTFLQRALDQGIKRGGRRAALQQFWTAPSTPMMQSVALPGAFHCVSDGTSVWVSTADSVFRVEASSGRVTGTWTGFVGSVVAAVVTPGRVFFVTQQFMAPSRLYWIDTTTSGGTPPLATSDLGGPASAIAFDGARIWIITSGHGGSVELDIVTPTSALPYPVNRIGFPFLTGLVFDGVSMWATRLPDELLRLDSTGTTTHTVAVDATPRHPMFDGANVWVPNSSGSSISIVSAETGTTIATIAGSPTNGLVDPFAVAFDGDRVAVVNYSGNVSMFKATDLVHLATVVTPSGSIHACSDGISFWVPNNSDLLRL